jgi:Molecular chaperone, HSP90 family
MTHDQQTAIFKANAHILEDLGLTLYTSIARVLVEFVANAYDADASRADIIYDPESLETARRALRGRPAGHQNGARSHIDSLTLPDQHTIVIEDDGHGMSRGDLEAKFLVAGRRRLIEEPDAGGRTPRGRPLMGRKGLGKLAGFGVAKHITVTSRASGEATATSVTLDYDDIVSRKLSDGIPVPIVVHPDGADLPEGGGTRITLKRLLHAPTKNRPDTIRDELAEHFSMISPDEFRVSLAGTAIPPKTYEHAFAWPQPERSADQLVDATFRNDQGDDTPFRYRIRFTGDKKALAASRRGIRVYSNRRLCAAPSLLGADTNMHGFRMVDYLEGEVHADFIASEPVDYIATDRQGLRWESPLLQPLYEKLSAEIKTACAQYQRVRDNRTKMIVEADSFTKQKFVDAGLEGRDLILGRKVAALLASACKEGVDSQDYKDKLPALLGGIGHGTILTQIAELATHPNPDFQRLADETAKLTLDEMGRFLSTVRGRVRAIEALRKIVGSTNFREAQNEKVIQKLLENSPWIIDPTYTQFLSADMRKRVLFQRLASELQIGNAAPASDNESERPDLVFLIGSEALNRLVIVELKSANTPLTIDHLHQLLRYVADATDWLAQNGRPMSVHGILIGTRGSPSSTARGVKDLRIREQELGTRSWEVRDYSEVLEKTEAAHHELLERNRDESSEELA